MMSAFVVSAQRFGSGLKKALPDSIDLVLRDFAQAEKLAALYNEYQGTQFKLRPTAAQGVAEKLKEESRAFLLPYAEAKDQGTSAHMVLVRGNSMSHTQSIQEDGLFIPDWDLELVVELPARKEWLYSDAILIYAKAIELLWLEGQTTTTKKYIETRKFGFENDRLERIVFDTLVVHPQVRVPSKFNTIVPLGVLVEGIDGVLSEEDIFDPRTAVFDCFEYKGKNRRFMYSMTQGLFYIDDTELNPEYGALLNRPELKVYSKFGLHRN